jgi:hypothetical protein
MESDDTPCDSRVHQAAEVIVVPTMKSQSFLPLVVDGMNISFVFLPLRSFCKVIRRPLLW